MAMRVRQYFGDAKTYNFVCQSCQSVWPTSDLKINWDNRKVCSRCWKPYPSALLSPPSYADPPPRPIVLPHDAIVNGIGFLNNPITPQEAIDLF